MSDQILTVSDTDFESEILQSETPAVVDFWATWCQPCLALGPIVEELAKDYAGKIKVAKMNVDDNPNTPAKYGIRSIPTILFFKGGELKDTSIGVVSKGKLEEMLKKIL